MKWQTILCFFGFHEAKSTFSVDSVTKKATSNCKHCDKDFTYNKLTLNKLTLNK